MSRRAAGVPKYGLHKPTGQARVLLDGRNHYLGKYGTVESQQKYEQLVAVWVASRRTISPGVRGRNRSVPKVAIEL